MSYSLKELTQEEVSGWDAFVQSSPDGTIFHTANFVRCFAKHPKFFYVMKGEHIKAALVVSLKEQNSMMMSFSSGLIHNGIIFARDVVDAPYPSRLQSARYEITNYIAETLAMTFDKICLRLSPSVVDIRPFQWFNYHDPNPTKRYKINVRFTSFLDLSCWCQSNDIEENDAFVKLGVSRKQEIRYAQKDGMRVEASQDPKAFLELYRQMAQNYNQEIEDTIQSLSRYSDLALRDGGSAKLYYALSTDSTPYAAALIGFDSKRAYYLYGVTSKLDRKRYSGSYLLWKTFELLSKEEGVTEVDMEGINSPQRGWFKLSFGGDIRPYFEITYTSPNLGEKNEFF